MLRVISDILWSSCFESDGAKLKTLELVKRREVIRCVQLRIYK